MQNDSESIRKANQESAQGTNLSDDAFEQIVKETEDSLAIPAQKRQPQILLCPVGLIGSGKTTVITPLSERLHLIRISGDEIRKRLASKGYNYLRVLEITSHLVKKYLGLGYSIAIDSDCAGAGRDMIQQTAKKYPAINIIWIHIHAPELCILERLRVRHPSSNDAERMIASYMRRKPLHERLDFPFLYIFDTSRDDLPQQINEAMGLIEAIQ